jgi:hypothetical protein
MKQAVLIIVAVALIWVAPAEAELIARPACSSPKCVLKSQTMNLKHARYVCRYGGGRNRRWSCAAVKWLTKERNQTEAILAALARPPHYEQWLCIHSYEGSWTDPNAPFWGGLQMDYGFQQAYGGDLLRAKGTADHWTPLEQMWVAERAYKTRGFYPWPNTARYCGLI